MPSDHASELDLPSDPAVAVTLMTVSLTDFFLTDIFLTEFLLLKILLKKVNGLFGFW